VDIGGIPQVQNARDSGNPHNRKEIAARHGQSLPSMDVRYGSGFIGIVDRDRQKDHPIGDNSLVAISEKSVVKVRARAMSGLQIR
jgi:hypothetical protein